MKPLKLKIKLLTTFIIVIVTNFCYGQEGKVTINQDKNIPTLLNLKKEINSSENDSERYRIQIYSGNRSKAESTQSQFEELFPDWHASIQYETPNFKIWAGNFRTRLEADRALKKIKTEFPTAFIFKPKKTS
ncbi:MULTISPECIES: SPOR domain-containing protein [Aestuariibaculum]|uniref:SPOR domain-containing protein n=1 Tax=Aestuariibaculum lutulentum TaxID=2920935 RepID=A0ABS9RM20_9FLAO|nr:MULTISPECIES: SPOR domain-containing protein [Aestuariibaculum]MCH4553996.1 SPOR domain-containing protein [Aestuariibaculum lutulentum]MCR8669493.1 SPOR domain-containing protein [Aestuariibaculum sp. M13]